MRKYNKSTIMSIVATFIVTVKLPAAFPQGNWAWFTMSADSPYAKIDSIYIKPRDTLTLHAWQKCDDHDVAGMEFVIGWDDSFIVPINMQLDPIFDPFMFKGTNHPGDGHSGTVDTLPAARWYAVGCVEGMGCTPLLSGSPYHVGTITFSTVIETLSDTLVTSIDTAFYPPASHTFMINTAGTTITPPNWVPPAISIVPFCHDVGATDIISPPSGHAMPIDYNVTVRLVNMANNDETFDVSAFIEDTTAGTIVWGPFTENVTLPSRNSLDFTFPDPFTARKNKVYHIVAYTNLNGDENPNNDTTDTFCSTNLIFGDIFQVIKLDSLTGYHIHYGVEFDGQYFYVTDSSYFVGGHNHIFIIDTAGNLVDSLIQPTSDLGWCDMALDCAHVSSTHNRVDTLFASAGSDVDMFGIDFSTTSLDTFGSFSGPHYPNMAMAYDCVNGYFYTAYGGYDIYQFTRNNPLVNHWQSCIPNFIPGAAYEPCTKKVWFSSWEPNSHGNANTIYEFDPVNGTCTGNVIEMPSAIGGTSEEAGGLTFWGNYNGYRVLIELVHSDPDYIAVIYLGPAYHCGDINGDSQLSFTDLQYLASYLFSGGAAPACDLTADVNGDGEVNQPDLVVLANYLYVSEENALNCKCCAKYWGTPPTKQKGYER